LSASTYIAGYRAYLRVHGIDEQEVVVVKTIDVMHWTLERAGEYDDDHKEGESFAQWLDSRYPITKAVAA
jgi:hypothetical protein